MTEQAPERAKRLTLSQIVEALLTRGSGEHSTVRLSRNARGDTQIEVAVRSGDEGIESIDQAAAKARALYDQLRSTYPMGSTGSEN